MHTENRIAIRGPLERIFEIAADIHEWPTILPHYRYVVVEESGPSHKVAWMGASRDGFPVRWKARQELYPESNRIRFTHIGGITKGMEVEWRLEPRGDEVEVTISHDLHYSIPALGPLFARWIVGELFVKNIAGKTLRCIQQMVETESGASSSPGSARLRR